MAARVGYRRRGARRARRQLRLYHGPHSAAHARGEGLRHPSRRGKSAPVSPSGNAGARGQERALARPRQDLQRLAGDAAHAVGERSRAERSRDSPSPQVARRAAGEGQGGALMLLTWMAYATLIGVMIAAVASALDVLAVRRGVATRFIWLGALAVAAVAPALASWNANGYSPKAHVITA